MTLSLDIMVGIPGSGKSTFAKKYANDIDAVIVESDKYREESQNGEQGNNNNLFGLIHEDIIKYLFDGKSVIFDSTALSYKHRMELINKVNSKINHVYITADVFATELEICFAQNKMRDRNVPENVIKRMRENFTFPQYQEGFHDIFVHYNYNKSNYNQKYLEDKMKDFNQDNPHHTGTLGEHTLKVFEGVFGRKPDDYKIQLAAMYHDIGKLYTKGYKNSKGEPVEFAHYYNHENVSTYESMFYLKEKGIQGNDFRYILCLIQNHMRPYNMNTDKSIKKFVDLYGTNIYNDLMILNEADKEGK